MSIKIASWNVNGIRAISKKEGFLDWFNGSDLDIINFQETKAQVDQIPNELTNIPVYNSFFSSAERKGYSGVASYSKVKPINVYKDIGVGEIDNEGRILRLDFEDFILFNMYFPNSGMGQKRLDYKLLFCNTLLPYLVNLRDEGNNIILTGDINIAHKPIDVDEPDKKHDKSGFLPEEREWLDEFLDAGFVDTFRMFNNKDKQYTWWSYRTRGRERNKGWRLDYFFVNKEFKKNVASSKIESNIMGSDHCPVTLEVNL